MPQIYILYEHASGFAVFRTTEFEEVAVFLPQVRESILNISKFRSNVFFVNFQSFKDQKEALHNLQKINSGELSKDIELFLENNIPRSKKSKQPVVLGVEDPDFATIISDKLGIKCLSSGLIREVIRGIRFHFYKLVKGFKDEETAVKSQLSLAHNYSRAKLNFDATRQDSMVIESNNLIDEFEKDINILGKRIRAWYSFHFPELYKLMPENTKVYIQCVNIIGDRKNLSGDVKDQLNSLLNNPILVENILSAAHHSMGSEIASVDLENLQMLCQRAISLINQRHSSTEYLKNKMNCTAPNLSALVGEMIASRLVSRAGGLEKLARLTSSTIQVLGAEKKLFRTLKDREEKAPISGLLLNSAFVGKAGKKKKGRLSRLLANKCALAARVDCFRKTQNLDSLFGEQLVEEVENDIKYLKKIKIEEDCTVSKKKSTEEAHSRKEKVGVLESLHEKILSPAVNSDVKISNSECMIESSEGKTKTPESIQKRVLRKKRKLMPNESVVENQVEDKSSELTKKVKKSARLNSKKVQKSSKVTKKSKS